MITYKKVFWKLSFPVMMFVAITMQLMSYFVFKEEDAFSVGELIKALVGFTFAAFVYSWIMRKLVYT